ncbi:MAG: DUF1611 domain-containing protein [Planctomycetota bacterium]|nr:DUF1611 domain-containing protein [Planctomycetota bacterium]
MQASTRKRAAIYTLDMFQTASAKTAHGLVRGPSRFEIVGLVDSKCVGRDAGDVLDGRARGIPTFADFDALFAHVRPLPDFVVVGVATSGGVIPPALKLALLAVVEHGVGIVSGLHEFVSDDPRLVAAARAHQVELIDVRKPKARSDLHFWSGDIRSVRAPRIPVLGTDCALGKRTTCHFLSDACSKSGLKPALVATGQTGWLQGIRHGFVLDTTPNDFVSGELEHAVVQCDRDLAPDVIFIEGQSSLLNPSGPCGAELILSAESSAVILQHAPGRRFHDDQEYLENEIAPLAKQIALIEMYGARVLGIALNDESTPAAERENVRSRIERESGLPTVWPLHEGCDRLVPPLRAHIASHTGHGAHRAAH